VANKYKRPKLRSEKTAVSENGTTAQLNNDTKRVNIGEKINKNLDEVDGKIVSLSNNLRPSANGCIIPRRPTTFGPFRRCTEARTFRSARVKNATVRRRGIINENT